MSTNDKLEDIRHAAIVVFSKKGYAETKIADIAIQAGVSAGTIYNYFTSKKELFDSLDLPELEELRPEFEQRRQDILQTALQLFGQAGYTGTTMDEIAHRLGLSKAALYQYFKSKEEIFATLVRETKIMTMITNLPEREPTGELSVFIKELGLEFMEMYNEPEKLNLLRMIICESPRFPELGRLIFDQTVDQANNKVASYLQKAQEAGRVGDINPKFAARAFLGMLLSFVIVDKLIINSDGEEFPQQEIVAGAVEIFLNGIGEGKRPKKKEERDYD